MFDRKTQIIEPCQPTLFPVRAGFWRGRRTQNGRQRRAPFERVGEEATAHVVDIIFIPVMGGAHGNDRFERAGRVEVRLQRCGAAPGCAEHAHRAIAPRLRGDPTDHILGVRQFSVSIHVGHVTLAVARATHVDPQTSIAVGGEIGMIAFVTRADHVGLAVRDVFKERGYRGLGRYIWEPQTRGQTGAAGHRDPQMLGGCDIVRSVSCGAVQRRALFGG